MQTTINGLNEKLKLCAVRDAAPWVDSICEDNPSLEHVCFGPKGNEWDPKAYCAKDEDSCPILGLGIFKSGIGKDFIKIEKIDSDTSDQDLFVGWSKKTSNSLTTFGDSVQPLPVFNVTSALKIPCLESEETWPIWGSKEVQLCKLNYMENVPELDWKSDNLETEYKDTRFRQMNQYTDSSL